MNKFTRPRSLAAFLVLVAALVMLPVTAALADKHDDHVEARRLLQQGQILPLAKILEAAQRRVPGDVIEVELEHEEEGWEYEVKVLTPSGHVRKISLNARTGAILKVKDD